jgi:heme o synthase
MRVASFVRLSKPGIIMGNCITAAGGFALASKGHFQLQLFLNMLLGLVCIIASACALNNYIDRFADAKMARTQRRPLPAALMTPRAALYFALCTFALGASILLLTTPPLAALSALLGFAIYVFFYSFMKYRSPYSTHLGSVAGAMPPLVGYFAASPHLDMPALLLFATIAFWQMPHFFAISLYRQEEYAAADIPILPLKKGLQATKRQMLFFTIAFLVAALSLYNGSFYLIAVLVTGGAWLLLCMQKQTDSVVWARRMFFASLIVITALSTALFF